MIRLKPTQNRVLVEPVRATEDIVNGVFIPEAHREKPAEGIVVNVGPDVEDVAIADRVFFNRFEGEDIRSGTQMFKLFREPQLLAKLD